MIKKHKPDSNKQNLFKPWYLLILAVVFTVVCVFALRANNLHMENLRSAVYTADKNNGNVDEALKNLQNYVTSHMNTNLSGGPNSPYPPIQLEYTYLRLQQAALAKLGYSNYYTEAQKYCESKYPQDFYAVVSCTQSYIETHKINIKVKSYVPPASLYEFNFLSPTWSPDLAGWSMVVAVVFWLSFFASLVIKKSHSSRKAV